MVVAVASGAGAARAQMRRWRSRTAVRRLEKKVLGSQKASTSFSNLAGRRLTTGEWYCAVLWSK